MGYQTDYKLVVVSPKNTTSTEITKIIAKLRNQCQEAKYAIDGSGQTQESVKWYEHETDMRGFSKQFPEHVFVLDGTGEDGKKMRKYFRNGQMQDANPIVVYEDFEESKLQ